MAGSNVRVEAACRLSGEEADRFEEEADRFGGGADRFGEGAGTSNNLNCTFF